MIRAQESSSIAPLSHLNLNSLHWDGQWDYERWRQNEIKMCRLGSWLWTFPPSEITWNHHHHFLSFSPHVDQPNIQNEPVGNCDTHTSRDQPSLLVMVVGAEERWGNGATLTITQLSAHSFPCRGWSRSTAGCWCLAHWHRPDRGGGEPMEDNNSIGVWQIRVKSNSPDFQLDSDRLMSQSRIPLSPPRRMDIAFYSTLRF